MENLNTLFNIRFVQPIRFFKAGYFDLASLDDTIIYSKNFKLPFVPSTDFNPASLIGGHSENNLFNKIESVKYFDSTTNSFDAICTPVNITVGSLFELDHLLSLIIRNYLGEKGTCENNQDLMIRKCPKLS